jgi:hypothetical protein
MTDRFVLPRRPRPVVEAAGAGAVSAGADLGSFEPPELPDDDRELLGLVESGGLLAAGPRAGDEGGCAGLGSILNLCWMPLRAARAEEEL